MTTLSAANAGTQRDRQSAQRALIALADLDRGTHHISVGQTRLRVSNLDKVLYPEFEFTKLDLLRSYAQLAPALIAHAHARPVTMKRYPDGVSAPSFFQKHVPNQHPGWVHITEPIGDHDVTYVTLDDVRTLLWAANLGSIELHVLLARATHVERPTALVFDLDPGDGAGIIECCTVALLVRNLCAELELDAYPKTSGSKGIQVYVPLNNPQVTYEQTKPFSQAIAQLLAKQHPALIVSKQRKTLRTNKVLIDWSQNDSSKTTVAAYSLRAREQPRVSTPVTWKEIETAAAGTDQHALRFETADVIERLTRHGDLFAPVLKQRQSLPQFL